MDGGSENNSPAFAINAAATLPERWACRPASFGKASKIPKVLGPRRMPNQAVVAGSSLTMGRPLIRKLSTSFSFPGFASRRTNKATLTMTCLLLLQRHHDTRCSLASLTPELSRPATRGPGADTASPTTHLVEKT